MMKILLQTTLLATLLMGSVSALAVEADTQSAATGLRLGYVNTERIYSEARLAVQAQKRLESEFQARQKALQALADKAAELRKKLEKMSADNPERLARERDFVQLERDVAVRQQAFREDFRLRRNEEFASVRDRANQVIQKFAKTENFDLIVQDAVYISPRHDITDRILKELDQ